MRLVACMAVFVAHSVVFFDIPGAGAYFGDWVRNLGYYGVIFFYSLSGFLITYLLLSEKKRTGTIAIGQFYKRRALRIWPLYYLIVVLSFFVFPHFLPAAPGGGMMDWRLYLLLFLLFLPNVAMLLGFYMPTNFHIYTIGFEEQFYLLWPLVVRWAGNRPWFLLGICFFAPPVLELLHLFIHSHALLPPGKPAMITRGALTFLNYSNIPAFSAGAAGAYWYFGAEERSLVRMGRGVWTWLLTVLIIVLVCTGTPSAVGYVNLVSMLFVFLILNLILSGAGRWSDQSIFSKGGKISYGMYIYHPVVLMVVYEYVVKGSRLIGEHPLIGYFIYLILSLTLLAGIAMLSYRYFEKPFLRLKDRFRKMPDPAIFLVREDSKK